MRRESILPEFVEFVPNSLEDGVLYISVEYATAVHKCCCGCGQRVVTPLSQTDWALILEGDVVSLSPSVGNWSYSCQSHYWIKRNKIRWARQMTRAQIDAGRQQDRARTERFYDERRDADVVPRPEAKRAMLSRLRFWLRKLFAQNHGEG